MTSLQDLWSTMSGQPRSKRPRTMCDLALGDADDIMPMGPWGATVLPDWSGPVPMDSRPRSPAATGSPASSSGPAKPMKATSVRPPPSVADARFLENALNAWIEIVNAMSDAFEAKGKMKTIDAEQLAPFFGVKKAGTLAVHASSWRLFLRYAETEGLDPSTLDESMAFQYLDSLARNGAPATRGSSFLKACNFAYGQLSFVRGFTIAQSSRCKGAAAASMSTKRDRKQRDPLSMDMLRALEVEVNLATTGVGLLTKAEAVVAGYVLFCVHTRSRCADAARIQCEPTLDDAPDNDPVASFIEAETVGNQLKTGNSAAKTKVRFPVAGLSKGLSNLPWAESWLSLRSELGFDAKEDECLMPEPLAEDAFGEGRIEAGQATEWMRHILVKLGFEAATLLNVGSHSCKATLLSACAKAGVPREVRRTLGGHAIPGDRSVDEYSRDVLADPLRQLGLLLAQIRSGEFQPDSSRSGRWKKEAAKTITVAKSTCPACQEDLEQGPAFKCPCELVVHDTEKCTHTCVGCGHKLCGLCQAMGTHICELLDDSSSDGSSSSEDDSDGEQVCMALEDEELVVQASESKRASLALGIENGSFVEFPEGGFFLNRYTDVAHQMKDAHTTACGIIAHETKFDFHYEVGALADKKLCWRSGCGKWKRT